ncbi:hypothetical protein CA85_42900 [Allorhodopirellula solitaria]|uniref:Uncharacterized protein n=1 Tax=Allorhodopirellula solitaria TaxID=2527987 RepID=A0A5C5X105_9BACT|nr:hypothetical protein CA85_42900 [Allorhodopirellula solitaria]
MIVALHLAFLSPNGQRCGVFFWLIRRKRAPEVFKAWLPYPIILQKWVPDERMSARDRQHHWRTIDRDIPCQASTSAELGSNGVDLSDCRL